MTTSESWVYAQQSVLGSLLIDDRCAPIVMKETTERDFQGGYQTVYRVLRQLFLNGSRIDPVVVVNALGSEYRSFILELMEITPTAANAQQYCQICRKESRAYYLRDLGSQMQSAESLEDLKALVEAASGLMSDKQSSKVVSMNDALRSFMDRHSAGQAEYLSWPIRELDRHIYAEPGDFIVIGAEPSVGKTAFAMQCARHFAGKRKVGFFSLETTTDKLFDRAMAEVMEINMGDLKRNNIQHEDWDRICGRVNDVLDMDLELISASGWTVADIRATTMIQGYQIIFVDYLQLIQGPGKDRPSVVTGVSLALHTLAQSLGVTVIALSQLTVDNERKGVPSLDSLRESRQIGQDADVVLMLSLEDREVRSGPRILTVQKNKEGRLCRTTLHFDGARQVFSKKPRQEPDKNRKQATPIAGQMELLPADTEVPFKD